MKICDFKQKTKLRYCHYATINSKNGVINYDFFPIRTKNGYDSVIKKVLAEKLQILTYKYYDSAIIISQGHSGRQVLTYLVRSRKHWAKTLRCRVERQVRDGSRRFS